ncbi:MAG: triphosphoribosyl-dephospho-CoA synthase [Gemmataceae bacterium]
MSTSMYIDALLAQQACLWEVTARKPGNVHRYRDFVDVSYLDFATSAAAIAPVLAVAWERPVGETIFNCVCMVGPLVRRKNTNLGIILLFAPLARAFVHPDYRANLERVLKELTVEDARWAFQAIRMANPGGLGNVPEQDVSGEPTVTLREAMELAADRDLVARQYANGFREVFEEAVPAIRQGAERTGSVEGGIISAHLDLMSRFPDTLIARKCGVDVAAESAVRAKRVLELGWPHTAEGRSEIVALDGWLRADGNRRNPGTTADLIAAALFVLLRAGRPALPAHLPWALREGAP